MRINYRLMSLLRKAKLPQTKTQEDTLTTLFKYLDRIITFFIRLTTLQPQNYCKQTASLRSKLWKNRQETGKKVKATAPYCVRKMKDEEEECLKGKLTTYYSSQKTIG